MQRWRVSVVVVVWLLGCRMASGEEAAAVSDRSLKVGAVLDLSGALAEHGEDAEMGARLAVEHVNRAGGVLGRPVTLFVVDGATDPDVTVAVANRLCDEEGIDVLVGAMGSEATLRLATAVSVPRGVPTISPSATAPQLSSLDDEGYLFRAVLSDAAQGPVLARLAHDDGISKIAVAFRDDAYGQGLAASFREHYSGSVVAQAIDPSQESFADELQTLRADGAEVLLVLMFPLEAGILVRQAIDLGHFERFLFGDGARSLDLVQHVGAEALQGMKGTVPAMRTAADVASTRAFLDSFRAHFGKSPKAAPSLGTYDAIVCFALAAERAQRLDGAAIRDALPEVCGGSGERFIAEADSIRAAFEQIGRGAGVNYDGAASTMDWNAVGDITSGQITVWEYRDGGIATVDQVEFDLGSQAGGAAPVEAAER